MHEDTLATGDTLAAPHGVGVTSIAACVQVGSECVRVVATSSKAGESGEALESAANYFTLIGRVAGIAAAVQNML